jgi:uncharacterized membrane-anchored protein YhcB (DUF1043 family)
MNEYWAILIGAIVGIGVAIIVIRRREKAIDELLEAELAKYKDKR